MKRVLVAGGGEDVESIIAGKKIRRGSIKLSSQRSRDFAGSIACASKAQSFSTTSRHSRNPRQFHNPHNHERKANRSIHSLALDLVTNTSHLGSSQPAAYAAISVRPSNPPILPPSTSAPTHHRTKYIANTRLTNCAL